MMTVISFASSKGGAGKTTSAILLGTSLAVRQSVIFIDADPAKRLFKWSKKKELPPRVEVMVSEGQRHIHDEIDLARSKARYVIVDMEGAQTRTNAYIMGESDLVIIPMGDEQQDAEAAIETLQELAREARASRRDIPVRILFARTKPEAVKSRLQRSLNLQVRDKIGSFSTELVDRTAFSSLHSLGGSLYSMDPTEVGGLAKAQANAELFSEEVIAVMRALDKIQGREERTNHTIKKILDAGVDNAQT